MVTTNTPSGSRRPDAMKNLHINLIDENVTGIRKLAQKFLSELLTVSGSMKYFPERGCNFLPKVRIEARTEFDVIALFMAAKHTIIKNLKSDYNKFSSRQDLFSEAKINKITLGSGTLQLDILVRNKAGQIALVKTPVIELDD